MTMWLPLAAVLALVACLPHESAAVAINEQGPAHPGPPPPPPPPPKPKGPSRPVPWQVMVYLSEGEFHGGYGGGALLSDRWVLTAGRNLFLKKSREDTRGQQPLVPKVYLGVAKFEDADGSKEAAVETVFLHPGFQNTSDWENDLALIKLKEPVNFNHTLMPIPLPEQGENQEERLKEEAIFGAWDWGIIHYQPGAIKYLKLPVVSREVCRAEYQSGHSPVVDDNMFCTGASELFLNVCFNDAGSALVFQNPKTNRVYAAGIVSYDKVCAFKKYAVHTRISAYLPWIRDVMRGDKVSAQRESLVANMYSGKI
ncbi:haptoglobin-like [Clupea harengus]|uniref:Haptoglobin-like n=1 Tax=Clupea harengus TaxID=7950 RepID=A0A6P3VK99_CLUHA|nr:haptoglobin-like [Clupea harengus]